MNFINNLKLKLTIHNSHLTIKIHNSHLWSLKVKTNKLTRAIKYRSQTTHKQYIPTLKTLVGDEIQHRRILMQKWPLEQLP